MYDVANNQYMIVRLFVFFILWYRPAICLNARDFYVRDLPLLPKNISIRMHAGHLPVNPQHHGALFFWHFASQYVADKARTVIWLNGGPGCSSLIGAWMEIGPFRFQDENTIVENNGSWNLFTNLLFVDQPVGTGFSYIDTDSVIHELDEMANQFLDFLDRYIEIFPELLDQDIYLAGESFAGQYIPYIAQAILIQRSLLKLHGLLIGNGWIDPLANYESYLPFAVAHHLVKENSILYDNITGQVKVCQQAYANHTHVFEKACDIILYKIQKDGAMNNHYSQKQNGRCVNVYDIRLDDTFPDCGRNWPSDLMYVTPYLQRQDVMSRIHVDSKKSRWTECSNLVLDTFRAYHSKASVEFLPSLLQRIPIVLYNGDYDLICNHWATEKMIDKMTWNGGHGFDLGNGTFAPTEPWIVENELAGRIRTARNLTYILFYNASHMVPYNQARRSRVMFHQFIELNDNFLIDSTTVPNVSVSRQVTHRNFKRSFFITLTIIISILVAGSVGVLSFFAYKWRYNRMYKPRSILRVFHSRTQQQLRLYSSLQDPNEYLYALENETFV